MLNVDPTVSRHEIGLMPVWHSVLRVFIHVKQLEGAFNQKKSLHDCTTWPINRSQL